MIQKISIKLVVLESDKIKLNHFFLKSDLSWIGCVGVWLNEYDDCMLRSPSVTTCWVRYGNVEFRGLDLIKLSALSSNFILRVSLEVKLELEIHQVSSVSFVGFKAECTCFNAKSSQIRLCILNVVYSSGTSHLKFLTVNIPTSYTSSSTINCSREQSP